MKKYLYDVNIYSYIKNLQGPWKKYFIYKFMQKTLHKLALLKSISAYDLGFLPTQTIVNYNKVVLKQSIMNKFSCFNLFYYNFFYFVWIITFINVPYMQDVYALWRFTRDVWEQRVSNDEV